MEEKTIRYKDKPASKSFLITDPGHPGHGSFLIGGFQDLRSPLGIGDFRRPDDPSPLNDDFAKMLRNIKLPSENEQQRREREQRFHSLFPEITRLWENNDRA
jgi:hypothetical protein